MKSYTDLEQSKKLAEFLPHESADMYIYKNVFFGALSCFNGTTQIGEYIKLTDKENTAYPCWSLTALLNVLPEPELIQNSDERWMLRIWDKNRFPWSIGGSVDPVDACYEMIIKLHEREML